MEFSRLKFFALLFFLMSINAFSSQKKIIIVSQDNSGDFSTIQNAINSIDDGLKYTVKISVKKGIYKEKITIPTSKGPILLEGENPNNTIITNDDFASKKNAEGKEYGTTGSSTFFIFSDNFTAKNITFENSAGRVGQAVAVLITSDKVVFENCKFIGNQDTLYIKGAQDSKESKFLRSYFVNCYIEGTTDYIFGAGTAVFENCTIYSKETASYITAASTQEGIAYGFVFINCKIEGNASAQSVYLGRPWRPFAKTVYVNCMLNETIRPDGWHNWNKPDAEKNSFYAEYKSHGKGANPSNRVSWSHQLTKKESQKYSSKSILKGSDNWEFLKSLNQ